MPVWVRVLGETGVYPVRRIFCVGRNYEAHAREMGVAVDREAPFYFTKPASAIVPSGERVPYPPGTSNYHYEMELVVALGAPAFQISVDAVERVVFGYAAGLDMTRRDLQLEARAKQRPWDLGKAFEQSAVIGPITKAAEYPPLGPQRIMLKVGETIRQDAHLSDLIWSVPEIVSHLSRYYHLGPGDIIYTGTPEGVGPVSSGDEIVGSIEGLSPVRLSIGPSE
ncbi:MAG: fumarylacetoacetate hydrolase family protein [Hyphomonadaceae bacterium]